ncbi:MAG TPA: hypothetical protein DIC22_03025 [Chitinophagaceae bacterium]|jgi:hypothetical protein|nr:hypothetical protein [Chitinophagaceae bacterium]
MRKFKYTVLTIVVSTFLTGIAICQETKNNLILGLGYFNDNNQMQYLKANTKTKVSGKFTQVPGVSLSFYISSVSPGNLLGKATTDDKGMAFILIPPAARDEWNKSPKQSFLVVSDSSKLYDAVTSSIDLVKARIRIDTAEDKKIIATLYELKDTVWVPVKGVDMRVAIKRLDGDLNVSEAPTYTTDSLGMISADFKQDGLPGDTAGNLILIAKVEDNDTYGNLSTEKTVPWGKVSKYVSNYNQRSLYGRRGWSPLWLEWMAYTIIAGVWVVLLYLFMQIRKLKQLGAQV